MYLEEHDKRDDMKVWLSRDEVDMLTAQPDDSEKRIAFALGARCGLRSKEALDVAPQHVSDGPIGTMLKVPDGKGGKYRETPIPAAVAAQIETVGDVRDAAPDAPVVSAESTRTLQRWIEGAREELREETGDPDWVHLTMHDLRRTWATRLAETVDNDTYVMMWGGWSKHETFRKHYRGAYSPEAQKRAREQVSWL